MIETLESTTEEKRGYLERIDQDRKRWKHPRKRTFEEILPTL
jgi:hypothetical protein